MESFSSRYSLEDIGTKASSSDMSLSGIRVLFDELLLDAYSYIGSSPEIVFYLKVGVLLAFIILVFYLAFTLLFG